MSISLSVKFYFFINSPLFASFFLFIYVNVTDPSTMMNATMPTTIPTSFLLSKLWSFPLWSVRNNKAFYINKQAAWRLQFRIKRKKNANKGQIKKKSQITYCDKMIDYLALVYKLFSMSQFQQQEPPNYYSCYHKTFLLFSCSAFFNK